MGDQDGDSYWGAYTGNCYSKDEVALQSLIHAPPYWPQGSRSDNWFSDYRTGAGFGWELGAKQGNGFTSETSIGGSATKSGEIKGITGSLTRGWELSSSNSTTTMTTTVHGSGVDTLPRISVDPLLHEEPSYAAVQTIVIHYWCYDYTESKTNALGTVPVCVLNLPYSSSGASLAYWYQDGMTDYADTWVPVGMNLAEGRNANQPNSWIGTPGDENAQLAVDGNTNGNFNSGSVAATLNIQNPWWELDLGGLQWIDAVQIWNRTDCCTNQLRNFYVFVTKENAFPAGTPEELAANDNVWFDHYVAGEAGRPTTVAVEGYGRRLRIQMATGTGTSFMNIAEVQVYGMPGTPDQWPKAATGTIATGSSFSVTWPGDRVQTVPGTLYYRWPAETTTLAVGRTDVDTPFHMGKGTSTENVTESGASRERSIGLGLRSRDFDLTFGTSQKQSLVTGWDSTLDFNGLAQGFPASAPKSVEYEYAPYVWLQEAKSKGGLLQQFLVLDYFVPKSTPPPAPGEQDATAPADAQGQQALAQTVAQIVPAAPSISSPTHPDPAAWYTGNTATLTWQQPPGDPAAQTYDWYLDRYPDSVPLGFHRGLAGTETYPNLEDGAWYLHVRAMSSSEDWGAASHRKIQVDANPPKVSLALDPPSPTGNDGWYVTPVNVTASADDGLGSGVAALEVEHRRRDLDPLHAAAGLYRRHLGDEGLCPGPRPHRQRVRAGHDDLQDRQHCAGLGAGRACRGGQDQRGRQPGIGPRRPLRRQPVRSSGYGARQSRLRLECVCQNRVVASPA